MRSHEMQVASRWNWIEAMNAMSVSDAVDGSRHRHLGAKLRLLLRNRQQGAVHTWHLADDAHRRRPVWFWTFTRTFLLLPSSA
jgi:hypothetical protein